MSKIDLSTVESGFLSQAALNSNFTKLETELQDKVLYRDNPTGEPNSMQQDLDMNGHRILNQLGEGGEGFIWKQSWNDGLDYEVNNIAYIPSGLWEGYTMICREEHTSSALFQTDYDAGKWEILAARGASGSGAGDLVSTNNLSDVASPSAALNNLNGMPKTGGTFTGDIIVPDEAYNASSWNGNNEVPTKNAIRDKLESLTFPTVLNATNDSGFTSTSSSNSISPEWVLGLLSSRIFTSTEQVITAGGLVTLSHGLGVVPGRVYLQLKCVTSDGVYSVDDIIEIAGVDEGSSQSAGTTVKKDATSVYVRIGSGGIILLNNSGTGYNITLSNYRLIVTASEW